MRKHYPAEFKAQVVLEALRGEKTPGQIASEHEIHPAMVTRWRKTVLEGLPTLFAREEGASGVTRAEHEQKVHELYAEIGRLSTDLKWLEKKLDGWSRDARLELLDRDGDEFPLSRQARLLGINRSGLYYRPVEPPESELLLKRRIDEVYTRWPFYGSRRITVELQKGGLVVNRKAVQRHMREMGIAGISPGPNLSRRRHEHQVYPYLLRGLSITAPDQVWGIDITYIRLHRAWMYLVALLDWYSRYVVDWEMGDTMEEGLVLAPVRRALGQTRPLILNSDQGSQFTACDHVELVTAAGVRISMDGRGRALDNIFTERLWRSLKYEEVYLREYNSPRDARIGVGTWLEFYNHQRGHQSLQYQTPAQVYLAGRAEAAAAVDRGEDSGQP